MIVCYNVIEKKKAMKSGVFMAKISLKTSLKTNEEKEPIIYMGDGIFDTDKIVYQEKDVTTILKKIENGISMVRRNNDYEISFVFDQKEGTKGNYHFFEIGKQIDLQITTAMLEWNSKKVSISYHLFLDQVDMGEFEYTLDYEVKE